MTKPGLWNEEHHAYISELVLCFGTADEQESSYQFECSATETFDVNRIFFPQENDTLVMLQCFERTLQKLFSKLAMTPFQNYSQMVT